MNGETQLDGTNGGAIGGDSFPEVDFLALFCKKFGCDARKFEKRIFLECVHPEGLLFARCLRRFNPGFFETDLELIEQIKHATSLTQVGRLLDFHDAQHAPDGLLRLIFKVRVSKQRLLRLAETLFAKSPPSVAPPKNAAVGG
jgi:hypothetical protein